MKRRKQAPVADAAAGHVARAEREVGAVVDRLQQAGEVGGIVGEVGVHLHHVARAVVERVAEAGEVGGPDAVLLGAVEHLHPVVLGGELVGELAGAVGRAVVDDEHAKALGRGAGEHLAGGRDDRLDVLGLVVGGQYQPGLAGHRSGTLDRAEALASAPRGSARGPYADGVAEPELSNAAIADALEELGDLYELDGAIVHRVLAYRTAAKAVREASVSVAALAREGRATELPGIGKTLQEKILTLPATGTIPAAERLRAKFPPGLIAITRLPGLGPKRARLLHSELGVDSPQALREAALAQRLRTVRGLGPKLEASVLAALDELDAHPDEARAAHPAAAGDRDRRGARRRPEHAGGSRRARPARRLRPPAGGQRQGHRPDRHHHPPTHAGQEPGQARADRACQLGRQGRREGAHPLGRRASTCGSRRPGSSATCCSTSPARARTTRRCARRRCAAACTSPSTASSTTPPASPTPTRPRRRSTSASASPTSSPSCARTAASWRRPAPGSCRS